MTTLGSRATRLQSTLLEPLEQLKTDIVYHLTALELQIHPWLAQVNRSLSHLKKAQSFFDSEAGTVCFNQSALFRSRWVKWEFSFAPSFYHRPNILTAYDYIWILTRTSQFAVWMKTVPFVVLYLMYSMLYALCSVETFWILSTVYGFRDSSVYCPGHSQPQLHSFWLRLTGKLKSWTKAWGIQTPLDMGE